MIPQQLPPLERYVEVIEAWLDAAGFPPAPAGSRSADALSLLHHHHPKEDA